jgi:hypothetical protein
MVSWEVDGTHPSFGQLLLLGRAAQLVFTLEGGGGGGLSNAAAVMLGVAAPSITPAWHGRDTGAGLVGVRVFAGQRGVVWCCQYWLGQARRGSRAGLRAILSHPCIRQRATLGGGDVAHSLLIWGIKSGSVVEMV